MLNQAKINNLSYLIDPTFNFVNRLFVLLFEKEDDRKSFSRYYTLSVDKKDFNVLIDDKTFFDAPIKAKKKHEKVIDMSTNNDHTTGDLLNYDHFSRHYKLMAKDLS